VAVVTPKERFPWITLIVCVIALVVVVVGGIVVIIGNMTFEAYCDILWKFAAAAGLTGIARGIRYRPGA
jgi:hypothetical protein